MELKKRVIIYLILSIIYFFCTSLFLQIKSLLKIENLILTLTFGFSLINITFSFILLKQNIYLNIIIGIILAYLCLFLSMKFGELHIFSNYDAYDILTSIISNIIFSIIFWEILYQIKTKKLNN